MVWKGALNDLLVKDLMHLSRELWMRESEWYAYKYMFSFLNKCIGALQFIEKPLKHPKMGKKVLTDWASVWPIE